MNMVKKTMALFIVIYGLGPGNFCVWSATSATPAENLQILLQYDGDYPVSHLDRLPQSQRIAPVGCIVDAKTFSDVWQAFKPLERTPEIDFVASLVIFVRNVDFYNRISLIKCTLKDGIVEVFSIETRSATPVEDKVSMSLIMVPRTGVKFIKAGEEKIPVPENIESLPSAATSPSQACYLVDKQRICLNNGHFETSAFPGSAAKNTISLFGQPIFGDLDGNGREDAVVLLVQDSGGTGTFYYVASAMDANGIFKGTNAVLIGDRISPQRIFIQNAVIVVNYANRKSGEPLAAIPSDCKSRYFVIHKNKLVERKLTEQAETHFFEYKEI